MSEESVDVGGDEFLAQNDEPACSAPDWRTAHERLVGLARVRAGLDFEEGQSLLAASRSETHARLGFGSFVEYIEHLFGYNGRLTYEKLRVAEALESSPMTARALQAGQTSWSAVRELTRVAVPETEADWLATAANRTVREIEKLVSGRGLGSRPDEGSDPRLQRHSIRLEVSGDTLAMFREAMAKLRHDAGERLDDDAAILLMARQVLQGPTDEGRASYQVAVTVCENCQRATAQASGEPVSVGAEVVAMASCDAQHVGMIATAYDPPDMRTSGEVPDTHVGKNGRDTRATDDRSMRRATQEVAPAVRRAVLRRDRGCCVFPGCRHATFVDIHHIVTRADGGGHDASNLVTVCSAHHRAIHEGRVIIEGSPSSGLRIRHVDGTTYGDVPGGGSASIIDARATALRALRMMGFREREVRFALARLSAQGSGDVTVEGIIRACLSYLTQGTLTQAG